MRIRRGRRRRVRLRIKSLVDLALQRDVQDIRRTRRSAPSDGHRLIAHRHLPESAPCPHAGGQTLEFIVRRITKYHGSVPFTIPPWTSLASSVTRLIRYSAKNSEICGKLGADHSSLRRALVGVLSSARGNQRCRLGPHCVRESRFVRSLPRAAVNGSGGAREFHLRAGSAHHLA